MVIPSKTTFPSSGGRGGKLVVDLGPRAEGRGGATLRNKARKSVYSRQPLSFGGGEMSGLFQDTKEKKIVRTSHPWRKRAGQQRE